MIIIYAVVLHVIADEHIDLGSVLVKICEQCVDIFLRVKSLEITDLLTNSDKLDRYVKLCLDRYRNTTLGSSVKLGDNYTVKLSYIAELSCLFKGILTCCSVQNYERLNICSG